MLESESASNRISTGTRITIRIYPLNHRASATIGIYIRIPERVARNSKQVLGTHIGTGALDEFATGTRYIVGQFEVFQSDEETEYPVRDQSKPGLAITAWVQYMLDNFATVDEAVAFIDENTFQVVSDLMPDGSRLATLHLSISDATGDCAIFEYTGGKLTVYHSKEYKVMTNSPTYNKQLALNEYWKSIGGLSFLPGTNRPSDRFARASFYINALPQTDDVRIAIASVFSVIRNTSVPYGISTPEFPEISTTQWRTVSDSKNLLYFFESSLTPNTFWVNLRETDLSEGAPVLKLSIANGETYHGNATKEFKPAQPFRFMGVKG